jgi:hypothetical protein
MEEMWRLLDTPWGGGETYAVLILNAMPKSTVESVETIFRMVGDDIGSKRSGFLPSSRRPFHDRHESLALNAKISN